MATQRSPCARLPAPHSSGQTRADLLLTASNAARDAPRVGIERHTARRELADQSASIFPAKASDAPQFGVQRSRDLGAVGVRRKCRNLDLGFLRIGIREIGCLECSLFCPFGFGLALLLFFEGLLTGAFCRFFLETLGFRLDLFGFGHALPSFFDRFLTGAFSRFFP